MKHTYDRQINFVGNIRQALQVATTDNETLFKIIMDTFQERDDLRNRASALTKERTADYKGLVALTEAVTGEPAENDFLSPDVLTTLISELRTERDELRQWLVSITEAARLEPSETGYVHPNHIVAEINGLLTSFENVRNERGELIGTLNGLKQLLDLPRDAGNTELFNAVETLELARTALTHDPRYIVHGHVQPCVVLYSDETTTLVRLGTEDMMCETSTIQWSDALTYRCQELLASAGLERGSMAAQRVLPVLAELVRDERVTLNDEGVAVEQPEFVAPVSMGDATSVALKAYRASYDS